MYYVSMTDTFLSGWGKAEGKEAKYINICDTQEEAEIVKENALARTDQKDIEIHKEIPDFDERRYHIEIKTKEDMPNWYKKGYFITT